ncbi:MAG: hypothetical protein JNK57_07125 [Planctomycetaceae bacterium]|jgi:hypothetical protein|nr:hypothetical protein [Planctomycetaceae bacterium]
MNPADDLSAALDPVCRLFESLGIRYDVGGSFRTTMGRSNTFGQITSFIT